MQGTVRAIEHIPASLKVAFQRVIHSTMSSRWGAVVLLAFVLLITGAGVNAWRLRMIQAAHAPAGVTGQSIHSASSHIQSTTLNVESVASPDTSGTTPQGSEGTSQPQASVEVNGQSIALPEGNGTVHKEITSNGSKTTIDISVDSNNSNASTSDNSSMNLNVHTDNNQSTSIDSSSE